MAQAELIVWIDLEMTGLDPNVHRVIEIATLVTDSSLQMVAEGPDLVISQPDSVLERMNDWSRQHHAASGLTQRVRTSSTTEAEAERVTLEFVSQHCTAGTALLAGNSVHMDRYFLKSQMPRLEAHLHYRNLDVTTVKELARRWFPQVYAQAPAKSDAHRALDDIRESIAELRFYRDHIFGVHPALDV